MAELAEKIYGDALFQSALEENKLEQVKAELDALTAVFQAEPAFLAMMDSPAMDAGDKQKILKETFAGSVEEILYNFLRILSDKRRMGLVFVYCRPVWCALSPTFRASGSRGCHSGGNVGKPEAEAPG